ncbi:MAG: formate dehydrogenase accessory sulfurtransferase FdhD [Saprospiraceae bacterium]|nr:formate dehydrogenase accessory sulfurtransferase FdhD [Saprospiraceae bacterium]MDW8485192.1 formate dehydrogenase accessory sulfurtransferase FdhD [Saprospiraceae bacterium]
MSWKSRWKFAWNTVAPRALRRAQATFEVTKGPYPSAPFDAEGRLVLLREDIGRYDAMDKVISAALR